ncbi:MAG TPA: hypothetical protein VHS05_14715 [Pyrinomonadaceae bacterium]|nr:hypothetical protein [Pyrinomonadaceae bacterium]
MSSTEVILIIGTVILVALAFVFFARPNRQVIQTAFVAIWNSTVGRHVLAILVLVFALQIVKSYARDAAEDKAGDWLTQYNGKVTTAAVGAIEADVPTLFSGNDTPTPTPTPTATPTPEPSPSPSPSPNAQANLAANNNTGTKESANPTATPNPTPDKAESARLKDQLQIIRDRAKHHGNVMAFFYVNYFISIVMVMTAGLIVAITLFFIAQVGWTGSNSYVRAAFIVGSAFVAFYGLFPPVFQQQKNISDNKDLFLHYKSLENEVNSYPITLLTLQGESVTPKQFINHVDAEMDRLGNIALGFDITKVSYEEAFQTARPTPTVTPPSQENPNSKKP